MKRIIFTLALAATFVTAAYSQKVNLESAITYFRNGDDLSLKDAKRFIDLAATNEETSMKAKTWYYRGWIYNKIAGDDKLTKSMDTNAAEKALESLLKSLELDKKLEYNNDELGDAEGNSTSSLNFLYVAAFKAYNVAFVKLDKGDYANTLKIYENLLQVYKYDNKGVMMTNNLSRKQLWELTAYANTKAGNTTRSKELYNILIDSNYTKKSVYTSLYNLYINDKDTTKAIGVLEKAERVFTEDPIFSEIEIQLYLASGNSNIFIEKVSQKIEKNPDVGKYYYYRGLTYEDLRNEVSSKKSTPASTIDSLNKLIEPDYKKAVELNDNDTFSHYNLGAFYYNLCVPIINKMGKPDDKKPDYKIRLAKLEAEKKELLDKARPHLEKAYELKDDDRPIVLALQHLYEQLKMTDKSKEFEAKAKALEPKKQ